ncbi:MAG TPA: pyridoxal-phosphate dependent enzyme, partial [Bacteroidales bacterium]|nr:pyridoxal-phosphate dependent enzyme [Bacteroidales bacterium]
VGGGSNAIGIFSAFLDDKVVRLLGAEGGGKSDRLHETAATLSLGRAAVFQGTFSLCLTDEEGNPVPAWSAAAGLDYPGISPQHAYLKESKRVSYFPVYDEEAYEAFKILSQKEGIIPALESAHAIALALRLKPEGEKTVVINLSGRGDKDLLNSISKA